MTLKKLNQVCFILAAVLALSPWLSSATALFLGIFWAVVFGNPFAEQTKKITPRLLSLAVIGLGAGVNLKTVAQAGLQGLGYTVLSIAGVFLLGHFLGKWLRTDGNTSLLITVGTAICGGSAIAAVAPVVRAKPNEVSVALGIVFTLNACALFLFPRIGHLFSMTQEQFGLWSALAIHDTSSVVGACLLYGSKALSVGTTVKLARALWIVPVTFAIGMISSRKKLPADAAVDTGSGSSGPRPKPRRPWFILGFLLMAAAVTWGPSPYAFFFGFVIAMLAKNVLVFTLFLIGSNLSLTALRSVGIKPFAQGLILWVVIAVGSLAGILLT